MISMGWLACDTFPAPLNLCTGIPEVRFYAAPVVTHDIPIDHRGVPPGRRRGQAIWLTSSSSVIGKGGENREYGPEDHSYQDWHGSPPSVGYLTQFSQK